MFDEYPTDFAFSTRRPEHDHQATWPAPPVEKPKFVNVPLLRGVYELERSGLMHEVLARGGIFCGGHVRWMCSPCPAHRLIHSTDIDIYPTSEDAFRELYNLFGQFYALEIRHENNMAVTWKVPKKIAQNHRLAGLPPVQLIKPVVEGRVVARGALDDILANFDFTVVRIGFPAPGESEPGFGSRIYPMALADADFYEDERRHLLRLKNIHCPVSSSYRVIKYVGKGYWIRPMQVLSLFRDWDQRDDVYRRQLISFLERADHFDPEHPEEAGLTKEQVDELEAMMRVD